MNEQYKRYSGNGYRFSVWCTDYYTREDPRRDKFPPVRCIERTRNCAPCN